MAIFQRKLIVSFKSYSFKNVHLFTRCYMRVLCSAIFCKNFVLVSNFLRHTTILHEVFVILALFSQITQNLVYPGMLLSFVVKCVYPISSMLDQFDHSTSSVQLYTFCLH